MSRWNFLKKIGIFNALAITLAGCNSFNPAVNEPSGVYGPPEMFEEPAPISDAEESDEVGEPGESDEVGETGESGKNETSKEHSKNAEEVKSRMRNLFHPEENEIEDVYGPPEMFE